VERASVGQVKLDPMEPPRVEVRLLGPVGPWHASRLTCWASGAPARRTGKARVDSEPSPVQRARLQARLLGPWSPARGGQVKLGPWCPRASRFTCTGSRAPRTPARVQACLLGPVQPPSAGQGKPGPVQAPRVQARPLGRSADAVAKDRAAPNLQRRSRCWHMLGSVSLRCAAPFRVPPGVDPAWLLLGSPGAFRG
jgi:hypothetical protein